MMSITVIKRNGNKEPLAVEKWHVLLNCHQEEYYDHAARLIAARLPVVPLYDEHTLSEYLKDRSAR